MAKLHVIFAVFGPFYDKKEWQRPNLWQNFDKFMIFSFNTSEIWAEIAKVVKNFV